MNKPIPALDENGDFIRGTLRKGGTVTIFTLNDGTGDEYPIVSDAGSHCSEDFLDIDKLRATVERARKMREASVDYGLQFTPMNAIPSTPARPTFAEALEREANLLYEAGVAIHGSERPETNVYRALIKAVERARRASEGE